MAACRISVAKIIIAPCRPRGHAQHVGSKMKKDNSNSSRADTGSDISRQSARSGRDGSEAKIFVSKIANAENEETGDGFDIFKFRKPRGRIGKVAVPCNESSEVRQVAKYIRQKNGLLPPKSAAESMIAKAIASEPGEYRLHSATTGWRKDNEAFVLLDRTIAFVDSAIKVLPPVWSKKMAFAAPARLGSVKSWRDTVSLDASDSSRLLLAISCAFAAPLLRICDRPPFMINLYGPSKSGKSTALLAAASSFGISEEHGLPNWNTTDAGFMDQARLFNDLLMPVNELALMKGKDSERRRRMKQLLYSYGEGRDTTRHNQSAFATPTASATFRGILVSTSEHSFADHAAEVSERQDAGEIARAHDVPVFASGKDNLFDLVEGGDVDLNAARRRLLRLRVAVAENYGRALPKYLKWLSKRSSKAKDMVDGYRARIVDALNLKDVSPAVVHAAENFGLIFAGGALAIDAKIVSWDMDRLEAAIVSCFEDFRRGFETTEDVAVRAKKEVLRFLDEAEFDRAEIAEMSELPENGVKVRREDHSLYVIPSRRFDAAFSSQRVSRAALLWLEEKGWLARRSNSGPPTSDNKKWAETFAKAPCGNFRAIKIKRPRKQKAA